MIPTMIKWLIGAEAVRSASKVDRRPKAERDALVAEMLLGPMPDLSLIQGVEWGVTADQRCAAVAAAWRADQ